MAWKMIWRSLTCFVPEYILSLAINEWNKENHILPWIKSRKHKNLKYPWFSHRRY